MQLQKDAHLLRAAGLELAAISYDSVGVLADFAKRKSISFPLLSDHDSAVIRTYGVADRKYRKGMELDIDNEEIYPFPSGNVPVFGLSYPAVFVVERDHRVKWRFVSEGSELRLTGAAILEQAVGGIAEQSRTIVPSRNIEVTASATNIFAGLGNRLQIDLELKIPPGFHVYSPQVGNGYIGVSWKMDDPAGCLEMGEPTYPEPIRKRMKSTGENLSVYEGTVRISREMIVKPVLKASDPSLFKRFREKCLDADSRITASGALKFQACDEQRCYPPQTVEPQWKFQFLPPDRQRSPEEMQREFEQD